MGIIRATAQRLFDRSAAPGTVLGSFSPRKAGRATLPPCSLATGLIPLMPLGVLGALMPLGMLRQIWR